MFITPAYAQIAGASASSLASIMNIVPFLLIGLVMYFMLYRPTQQQQKTLKTQLGALKRGDKIVTAGGILGTVKKTTEAATEIDVEIAPNVTVSVVRSTITKVVLPEAANDK